MGKKVDLPIVEPIYSTYQYQGCGAATIYENPSIRNWYLNETVNLTCNRKFLSGFTTPEIDIVQSHLNCNPHLQRYWIPLQFTKGYFNPMIREMLNRGYYVYFVDFDDYFIKGKSWYKEMHIWHDGLICGYDQEKNTYSLYSYDSNWVCRKFETSQRALNDGRRFAMQYANKGTICAIKPKPEHVAFHLRGTIEKIKEYLDSSLELYSPTEEGKVYGIVVLDYIAMYLTKLQEGYIPYERMDRRVFRVIWEHKKAMYERLIKIEEMLHLESKASEEYQKLVKEADTMRILYASHHLRRRDSVLPIIRDKLLTVQEKEREILNKLIENAGGAIERCNYGDT